MSKPVSLCGYLRRHIHTHTGTRCYKPGEYLFACISIRVCSAATSTMSVHSMLDLQVCCHTVECVWPPPHLISSRSRMPASFAINDDRLSCSSYMQRRTPLCRHSYMQDCIYCMYNDSPVIAASLQWKQWVLGPILRCILISITRRCRCHIPKAFTSNHLLPSVWPSLFSSRPLVSNRYGRSL